jgi:hypothetical protein
MHVHVLRNNLHREPHHTIPFLDWTRKRIWGDVMGRQF